MTLPSRFQLAAVLGSAAIGVLWGLSVFVFREPLRAHWAEFAYGFMAVAGGVVIWALVEALHAWLRWHHFREGVEGTSTPYLISTQPFDLVGFTTGIVERAVFTTLALWLLTTGQSAPLMVEGHVGVLASIAGGWIALKTVMGWRRITSGDTAIQRLSMVGLIGSLGSVFLGLLAGVLTLRLYFQ